MGEGQLRRHSGSEHFGVLRVPPKDANIWETLEIETKT